MAHPYFIPAWRIAKEIAKLNIRASGNKIMNTPSVEIRKQALAILTLHPEIYTEAQRQMEFIEAIEKTLPIQTQRKSTIVPKSEARKIQPRSAR